MESTAAEECIRKRKIYQKKVYEEKKKTITPEEKAARAKYMREYRAKKKMQKNN